MTWRTEKTDEGIDLVWDGVETGIAVSPTKGTANIQNANISTETGEILASFGRTNQSQATITNGTLTASVPNGATLLAAPANLQAGTWIQVTASTITSITASSGATTAAINYLVVAGGGGGGSAFSGTSSGGGGGGAGGMLASTSTVAVGTYAITVGAGGTSFGSVVTSGSNSVLTGIATATGGGAGAVGANPVVNALNGGSGGGGSGEQAGGTGTAGTGTGGQGTNGGTGRSSATASGGGGGGATGVGGNAGAGAGGAGGAGTASSISGTSVTYAGGGGGGRVGSSPGAGGTGGGGSGGITTGGAGTANTGGGGGGAADGAASSKDGGAGGSGIVIISYVTGAVFATGGTVTTAGGNTIHTFLQDDAFTVYTVNGGGYYYVSYKDTSNRIKLSASYDPTAAHALTHGTSGTATFSTVAVPGSAIAKATEKYTTATTVEYRYYVLDFSGYVWVYDTGVYDSSLAASGVATLWMLPDMTNYGALKYAGMAVLNGWLMTISSSRIWGKPTVNLGNVFRELPGAKLNTPFSTHTNFAYVGHQGKMYYCDGNYIGELFPTTSLVTNIANIQSFSSYTASGSTGTVSAVIGGSLPYDPGSTRIPAVFFTDVYGTLPTAILEGVIYYIQVNPILGTFTVHTTSAIAASVDISTGAVGTQYFNTFYPLGLQASIGGTHPMVLFTAQRVNLPFYETAQCMVEIGNTIIIGGIGSTLYPWNQIDATPSDFIELPESNTVAMVNVNNMAYVFAGNKGNIYITNNSVASLVLSVPDYCAGVPGTPLSYIEPYFAWGDATYLRGRVYFSILDQTATKAGNCGGVWSFVPSQNFYYGQDIGLALRLENQNSYGNYSGVSSILIANEEQNAVAPQYWSWWQSSYSRGTSTFGVDQTAGIPVITYVFETDLAPTGTLLSKKTFTQLEYKLTTQLAAGDSVQLYYRMNSTDAWATCGTTKDESGNQISGYYDVNFERTQWVQFRGVVTTAGTTASSFVRMKQLRLR